MFFNVHNAMLTLPRRRRPRQAILLQPSQLQPCLVHHREQGKVDLTKQFAFELIRHTYTHMENTGSKNMKVLL